jgi:hypothetical protein
MYWHMIEKFNTVLWSYVRTGPFPSHRHIIVLRAQPLLTT